MYEQYVDWKALKEEFGDQGFEVLSVPSNNFGLQEPGENSDLFNGLKNVRPGGGYVPNFRVAAKHNVNGVTEAPLYTYIKERCAGPQNLLTDTEQIYWSPVKQSDITWNYEKILVDHEGKPYKRYVPAYNPQNPRIRTDIQDLLARRNEQKAAKVAEKSDKKHNLSEVIKKALHH